MEIAILFAVVGAFAVIAAAMISMGRNSYDDPMLEDTDIEEWDDGFGKTF